jgi:bifunctional DNA-binding transcriptional regulator/antitoxin component of YhaV-PrlF toxin-antitoxin module
MRDAVTTLTQRGQVSLPASIRKAMRLRPGQRLRWQQVSETECRLVIEEGRRAPGPLAVLGYARRLRPGSPPRPTAAWMKELRAGERR